MKIKYIYNPFERLAGIEAVVLGLIVVILMIFFSSITGTHIIGYTTISYAKDMDWIFFFLEYLIHLFILILLLYLVGKYTSKSQIRFVDVLGTALIARTPILLLLLLRLMERFQSILYNSWELHLLNILFISMSIWSLVLVYNAYTVSCNIGMKKSFRTFIPVIILSEILSQILILKIP